MLRFSKCGARVRRGISFGPAREKKEFDMGVSTWRGSGDDLRGKKPSLWVAVHERGGGDALGGKKVRKLLIQFMRIKGQEMTLEEIFALHTPLSPDPGW